MSEAQAWNSTPGPYAGGGAGPRPRRRSCSQLFYETYPGIDGLYYVSSMHRHAPLVALYERATSALPKAPDLNRALADPPLAPYLPVVATTLGYRLWPPLTT